MSDTVIFVDGADVVVVADAGEADTLVIAEDETVVIASESGPGPQGDVGPTGPTGPPGPSAQSYVHVQGATAATWVVDHNLGFFPGGLAVVDSAGTEVEGEVQHTSINQLVISFATAFQGQAYVS